MSDVANIDDSLIDELPLIADPTFVPTVHTEVLKDSEWVSPTLHSAVKFAWAVLLRECASRAAFEGQSEKLKVIGLGRLMDYSNNQLISQWNPSNKDTIGTLLSVPNTCSK